MTVASYKLGYAYAHVATVIESKDYLQLRAKSYPCFQVENIHRTSLKDVVFRGEKDKEEAAEGIRPRTRTRVPHGARRSADGAG